MSKKKKHLIPDEYIYDDCDDIFAFIAGYTDGGVPYGITWEEENIDPDLPFDEKIRLYQEKIDSEMGLKPDEVGDELEGFSEDLIDEVKLILSR